ncbi:MAG: PEGA domain-containing protein [Pseudomonadales bacterium]
MSGDNSNIAIAATPFTRVEAGARKKRLALRPLPIAIAVLFFVLSLAALFMFTAKAVKFNVIPMPEQFEITSGFFTYRLGERYLMLPGDYKISAQLAGFNDLHQDIGIGDAADQDLDFVMAPLPGILVINISPEATTEIFVDQISVGTVLTGENSMGLMSLTLDEIEPGLHDISLRSKRYLPFETEIDIEGKRIKQQIEAELEPAWAEITLSSLPQGATVYVDAFDSGQTSVTIEVLEGRRQIKIKKPGYKVWQTELAIVHGEHQQIPEINLTKSDGKVSINTDPAGVNITINKRYRGQSPLSITLAPGNRYEVLLSKAGYTQVKKTFQVEPDEDISLNLTLMPIVGSIRLSVQPAGGELFVDGVSAGDPSQILSLTASRHVLRIEKEGYAPHIVTVTPQPDLSQQLMITLQTTDEAKLAAIPQTIKSHSDQLLKLILPGEMAMGAGRRDRGRRSNEIEKDVLLTKAYYLGINEVTNKQYTAYRPGHDSGVFGRSLLNEDERPVVNISWDAAVQYCNWLSLKDSIPVAYEQANGKWNLIRPATTGYRLPSEAEWAWAARYSSGPIPTRFPWGDAMPPPSGAGNFADESAAGMVPYHIVGLDDSYRGPAPVGTYQANSFGIYDLAGNVSEWTTDFYSVELERDQLIDPSGPDTGDYYVIRGSNYANGRFSELRWTFRDYGRDARRDVGFRIARYVE